MIYKIIIVTGSKKWKDRNVIYEVLDETLEELHSQGFGMEIHVGDASGADQITHEWVAEKNGGIFVKSDKFRKITGRVVDIETFNARWNHCSSSCGSKANVHMKLNRNHELYCPSAGMRRNAIMVARGGHLCLAFILDCSSGSTECAKMAEKAGIETIRYRQGRLPADSRRVDKPGSSR